MYFVIEGIDTCGKSTLTEYLKKYFEGEGFTFIREPGQTDTGKEIRNLILKDGIEFKTELFLFLADRAETYGKVIKPVLEQNGNIISDRSFVSNLAYADLNKKETEFLLEMNKYALNKTFPDAVIILKIKKETLINRLKNKKTDKFEQNIDKLLKIQNNILNIVNNLKIPHIVVNADLKPEHIAKTVKNFIIKHQK